MTRMPEFLTQDGPDVVLRVKVVPGASRSAIAGPLGARLKIRIAAPPEAGKANAAVIKLLARRIGCRVNQITIASGHASAEKTVRVAGADAIALGSALAVDR
jgi:hypothetical protein